LLAGGDRGPAIEPGHPERSLLIEAIGRGNPDLRMPPDRRLSAETVREFESWIREGAQWPSSINLTSVDPRSHWAFRAVRPPPPPLDPTGWSQNPIDSFLLARFHDQSLTPNAPADRPALLRRLSFDLCGLTPSLEEQWAFLEDNRPTAYARLVDRLLASPAFGERWGRHWLDIARYADTAGDNADYPIPEARHYRDYVIDAFNDDLPYDQFIQEQLAGDLIEEDHPDPSRRGARLAATGFIALSRRYATGPRELWHLVIEDTIETTGRAFLGLSIRCARCHDHKYDPITQRDYYALYGVFASTRYPYPGSEEYHSKQFGRTDFSVRECGETEVLGRQKAAARLALLEKQIRALEFLWPGSPSIRILRDELVRRRKGGSPPELSSICAVVDEEAPADARVMTKGEPDALGEAVPRGGLAFFGGASFVESLGSGAASRSGRRELASWICDLSHPLPARVIANRLWQHHFGQGIVATSSNFGLRGERPTHPELLDWLAHELTTGGWTLKRMHRLMVMSAAYRLSSARSDGTGVVDPENRWRSRQERPRLDAEALRDAMLLVSGRLDRQRPGAHPFPPFERWTWTQHQPFQDVYPSSHRSVYLMTQRLRRHPFLGLFDGPDGNISTDVRTQSIVPLQALYVLNNPEFDEIAGALGERLRSQPGDFRDRCARGIALCWGRSATTEEAARGADYVRNYLHAARESGMAEAEADRLVWASYARVLLSSGEFLFVD
jgi:hypothetical protein